MRAAGAVPALLLAAFAALGISVVQPTLAQSAHKVRQRDDAFLLPPPAELRVMALGNRAAAADLLWANLLLEYGLHWQERRPFPDATRYIDGILALEPDFKLLYEFVDTILVYSPPPGGSEQDVRAVRRYLERGTAERPYDADVWLHYGQFLAFLAPSFLKDEQEIQRWRVEGATAITRAVELGTDAQRSLAATTILSKSGERRATIQHLERAYAMTDDPDMREQFLLKLRNLQADDRAERSVSFVDREWKSSYGFLSRGTVLLIGPRRSPAACAGTSTFATPGCAGSWPEAVEQLR